MVILCYSKSVFNTIVTLTTIYSNFVLFEISCFMKFLRLQITFVIKFSAMPTVTLLFSVLPCDTH